nr:hypothetical protein BaRGS_026861 [Batillaria attramentaria]
MISFPHVDIMADHWCRDDRLLLYEGGNSHRNVIKTICEKRSLAPEVLNTTVLYVRFVSFIWSFNSGTGFRLLFSFHDRQSQPEKLPGGTWNCSVPYWDDFKQHFPCDLQPQCANGEDELDCSYTTDTCGPGLYVQRAIPVR